MLTRNNNKTSDWLLSILKLAQISKNDSIKQQLKKQFPGKDEQIDYLLNHPDVTDINVARWLMKNDMTNVPFASFLFFFVIKFTFLTILEFSSIYMHVSFQILPVEH